MNDRLALHNQMPSPDSIITREEVVAEAEADGEVDLYDGLLEKTGPFTRQDWEHHRWDWRCAVNLPSLERALFFQIDRAHRLARGN